MKRTAVALVTQLIDYAGLFPPANLDLARALRNYRRYLDTPAHWLLARFIIPTSQLEQIKDPLLALFSAERPLRLSLLSGNLAEDIERLHKLQRRAASGAVRFEYLEARLGNQLDAQLEADWQACRQAGIHLRPFYELSFDERWDARLAPTIDKIARFNRQRRGNAAFKLRCGGVRPDMFPSPQQVAQAIIHCRDAGLAMKFTAGLHHPLRHYDATLAAYRHGFVNLFVGGSLAHSGHLTVAQLTPIIAEQDAAAFTFDTDQLTWRDRDIFVDDIGTIRKNSLISYGSCSFDEPVEDLQKLGWLPRTALST